MRDESTIVLFDVDGTLTPPRGKISIIMAMVLKQLQTKFLVGVVGGSDLAKQKEQLGDVLNWIDYSFSENGLVAYKNNELVASTSLSTAVDNHTCKQLINFCLRYIAELDIPVKRGTFVEYRNSMINISPIGRNCSQQERDDFEQYDLQHGVRQTMVEQLRQQFGHVFSFAIGGQISIDAYPIGWDKTYCLNHLQNMTVHFFGDRTAIGGNDYELYSHSCVDGYHVDSHYDTYQLIQQHWIKHIHVDVDHDYFINLLNTTWDDYLNDSPQLNTLCSKIKYEMIEAYSSRWVSYEDIDKTNHLCDTMPYTHPSQNTVVLNHVQTLSALSKHIIIVCIKNVYK